LIARKAEIGTARFDLAAKRHIIGEMKFRKPQHVCSRIVLALILTLILASTATPRITLADIPTVNVIVALAPIDRTSPVEMVALTLDGNLSESNGHTIVQGNTSFKLHNTDILQPVTLPVGFPEWAGGALSFDPAQFSDFSVSVDGKKIVLVPANAPVQIGKELRPVNWYSFDLKLDPDEKKVVSVEFTQDLGGDILPRFTYGLLPSNGWKGPIGSARLTVNLPVPTTGEQFIALDPSVPQFDGEKLNWLWINFNPDADPGVTLIRPSIWADLLDKRAAAEQNPNDPALHFALGGAYQQLAGVDSARRDNFLAQAVAELETASRLDPKDVDAVTSLAQLYETRAGPAAGPRDVNYVGLALAEWQNLVGTRADADARKHCAEDSFYLAVAARSRGENDLALKLLQDAANFSPQGAGPLFTREHWATEWRAVQIALARAAEEQGQVITALTYARAAFGKDFDLAPSPPLPSFALEHAQIVTTSNERQITLSLLTYPGPSTDAQQAVDAVVATLSQIRTGTVARVEGGSDYGLMITVPFNSDRDLKNRLTALGRGFPEREDWTIMRAVVDSPTIEWGAKVDTFRSTMRYREDVDLASSESPLQEDLNKLSQTIGELEASPPGDDRAQLRLALLRDSQQWWQQAVTAGSASFLLQPSVGPARSWSVNLGEKTTLSYEDSEIRPEWYLIGGLGALFVFLLVLLLSMIVRSRTRRREPA
jgi:tetratricopeptide (TPR) repeat protein